MNCSARVAQLIERQPSKLAVAGLSPAACSKIMAGKNNTVMDLQGVSASSSQCVGRHGRLKEDSVHHDADTGVTLSMSANNGFCVPG